MMTRGETILCWGALPLGFSAAYITVFISEHAFGEDPIYGYFYGFLAFLGVQLVIALWLSTKDDSQPELALSHSSRASRNAAGKKKKGEIWLNVQLSNEAMKALQTLMSLQDNAQSEAKVIDHLLVKYQKTLRKRLLGDWSTDS